MKFTQEVSGAIRVHSVDEGRVRVGSKIYERSIALTVDAVLETWTDKEIHELEVSDFAELFNIGPEVVVLGTGTTNIFPPRELVFAMARLGIGLEVMDTGAAARTFNVLAGEGRKVAAVLYI